MTDVLAIRARRGKWTHGTTEGSRLMGSSLCGRQAEAWTMATSDTAVEPEDLIDCPRCVAKMKAGA